MKGVTINHVAFGSALLLHVLFLSLGGMNVREPEPPEQVTIRFTSSEEQAEPVAPREETIYKAARPYPAKENKKPQGQQAEMSRPPVRELPLAPTPAPVVAPAPIPAPRSPAPLPAVAHSAPPGPVQHAAPVSQQAAPEMEKQSHTGKTSDTVSKSSVRLADYLSVVRAMVENNREYPAMARQLGLQGTVTVRVTIRGDGSIFDASVVGSSGHKSLDKAALSAVRRSAPFKAPGGFGLEEVTVEIPIVYRLT